MLCVCQYGHSRSVALARALVVEVRPLAASDENGAGARFLGREDFEVKTVERASASEAATYVLVLRQPIATGQRVAVRLRLTLEDPAERAFWELGFTTAEKTFDDIVKLHIEDELQGNYVA